MRIFYLGILYLSIFFSVLFASEREWTRNSGETFKGVFVQLNERDVVFDNKEKGRSIVKLKDLGYQDIDNIKEIEKKKRKENGVLEPAFKWYTDIEEAKRAAEKQGLPILVYHFWRGCSICWGLKEKIFDTKEYEEYARDKVISVIIDTNEKSKRDNLFILKCYGMNSKIVRSFPRVVILNKLGIPIYERRGCTPSELPSPREYLDNLLKHYEEDNFAVLMACKMSDGLKSRKTVDYKKISQILLEKNPNVLLLDNVFIGKEKNTLSSDKIFFETGMRFFCYEEDKGEQGAIMGVLAKEQPVTITRTDFSKKYKGCNVTCFEFDKFVIMGMRFAKGTKEKGYLEIAERILEMSKKYNKKVILVSGDHAGWRYDAAIGGTFINQSFTSGKIDKDIEYPGMQIWIKGGERLYVDHIDMKKNTYSNAMRLVIK